MSSRRDFLKVIGLGTAGAMLGGAASEPASSPASSASSQPVDLPKIKLGKTEIMVPRVMFGGNSLTKQNANVFRAALARGLNFVDTSFAYQKGNSELTIGEVVKGFGRDKVIIQTKASGLKDLHTKPVEEVEKQIRSRLETSLKRLQTDYIDIYLCPHGASNVADVDYPQLREVVEKLKKEGKIRAFGLSTHSNYAECTIAAAASGWHDVVMPALSMASLDAELLQIAQNAPAAAAMTEEGSAAVPAAAASAPTSGPARKAKQAPKRPVEDFREAAQKAQAANLAVISMKGARLVRNNPQLVKAVTEKFATPAKQFSLYQICLRWLMDQPYITSVNVGLSSMSHLEEALALPKVTL